MLSLLSMNRTVIIVVGIITAVLAGCLPVRAQVRRVSAGGFYSFKGCGLSVMFDTPEHFSRATVLADFTGLLSGSHKEPGVQAGYWVLYPLARWDVFDDMSVRPYVGPGLQAGYVRDYDKGFGVVAALGAGAGFRADFSRRVSIDLGWTVSAGVHLQARNFHNTRATVWQNGIYKILLPELSILYRF